MELEEPTASEQSWLEVLDELCESTAVEVLNETRGDIDLTAEDTAFDDLAEWEGFDISAEIRGDYLRFSQLGSQWRTLDPYPDLTGEFCLVPLPLAVHEDAPEFPSALYSDEQRELATGFRVIDSSPLTGTGSFAVVRLQRGVGNPEVWFSDHQTNTLWRMGLDYRGYLDALRLTKGVFGWQHLFTKAPLDDQEFAGTAADLQTMLDVLPELFPDHDYSDLRARLRGRT
ncbi:hypothetical protein [Saccharomonospora xinjiangensis]|uniref:Uncharacterized protein n=1 Tax=Saccharomonospora xinjiangensis XJ-54 TaxID=882086 RepID=I0V850_9PSEU|nr:hypothetical protein [Saccharomonospora xinjiangensis]EID56303.1 hypothetical protein SacxiDRAFT_4115 [Saccharomonospora xinjiangensis XJ-54]